MKFPFQSAKVQKKSHICKFSARKCQRDKKIAQIFAHMQKLLYFCKLIMFIRHFAALAHR